VPGVVVTRVNTWFWRHVAAPPILITVFKPLPCLFSLCFCVVGTPPRIPVLSIWLLQNEIVHRKGVLSFPAIVGSTINTLLTLRRYPYHSHSPCNTIRPGPGLSATGVWATSWIFSGFLTVTSPTLNSFHPLVMIPFHLSLAALSCLSFVSAEPLHIPLVRKRDPVSVDEWGAVVDALESKNGYPYASPSKRQNAAAIPIICCVP